MHSKQQFGSLFSQQPKQIPTVNTQPSLFGQGY